MNEHIPAANSTQEDALDTVVEKAHIVPWYSATAPEHEAECEVGEEGVAAERQANNQTNADAVDGAKSQPVRQINCECRRKIRIEDEVAYDKKETGS
jgi:hypothetical protein